MRHNPDRSLYDPEKLAMAHLPPQALSRSYLVIRPTTDSGVIGTLPM
jgi:hypothetical protein